MNKPLEIELPEKASEVAIRDDGKRGSYLYENPYEKLVQDAFARGDLSIVEKAMTLQLRWEDAQARRDFDEAIAAAKVEIPPITKNRSVGYKSKSGDVGYRHEDLAEIARTIDPILGKYGLSYRWRTTSLPNEPVTVTCVVSHRRGYSEENTLTAGRDEGAGKNSIQAIGSTITYLQRYTLKAALGLAASNDDDASSVPAEATLSDEQVKTIVARIKKTGADRDKFLAWAGVGDLLLIPASRFDACLAALDQVQSKKQQQARGNAQRQQG